MDKKEAIREQIIASHKVFKAMFEDLALIEKINIVVQEVVTAYRNGGKTIWAGNGGSAADAQHLAAELEGRFQLNRAALPALALNTNTSIITAVGNDFGYDQIFARQMEANGKKGDVFFAISTSGNSKNIVQAVKMAKKQGVFSVCLTGEAVGELDDLCDLMIKAPSTETPRIQEAHILIGHIICGLVEKELVENELFRY